ncbi:MAG: hypothetical protein A4S12_01070 [Proteobacteria bacterium SG_bin5]|nr:MAG: hypothetical protein A4S12_01070 [Proteobacteria bacterium SG_bin5]
MEGPTRGCKGDDGRYDRLEVGQYIAGRDTQRFDAVTGEQRIALGIPRQAIAALMRFAIDLDAKFRLGTIEVQHIGAGGMLVAELKAVRPRAQRLP